MASLTKVDGWPDEVWLLEGSEWVWSPYNARPQHRSRVTPNASIRFVCQLGSWSCHPLQKAPLGVQSDTSLPSVYRMGGDRDKWDWVAYTFSADSFQLKECVGKGRASSSLWGEDHNLWSCGTLWPPCPESLRCLFLTYTCPPWILVLRCITKESEKMGSFFHPLIWKSQTALTQSLCGRDWRGRWWIFDFGFFYTTPVVMLNKTLNQAHLPAMVCGLTGRTLTHGQVSSEIVWTFLDLVLSLRSSFEIKTL